MSIFPFRLFQFWWCFLTFFFSSLFRVLVKLECKCDLKEKICMKSLFPVKNVANIQLLYDGNTLALAIDSIFFSPSAELFIIYLRILRTRSFPLFLVFFFRLRGKKKNTCEKYRRKGRRQKWTSAILLNSRQHFIASFRSRNYVNTPSYIEQQRREQKNKEILKAKYVRKLSSFIQNVTKVNRTREVSVPS